MYVRQKKEKGRTKPEQEQIWNGFKMYLMEDEVPFHFMSTKIVAYLSSLRP